MFSNEKQKGSGSGWGGGGGQELGGVEGGETILNKNKIETSYNSFLNFPNLIIISLNILNIVVLQLSMGFNLVIVKE